MTQVSSGSCARSGAKATYTRDSVECRVECHDQLDAISRHHCSMQGIAGRQARNSQDELSSTLDIREPDRNHLVDDTKQDIERRLNRVTSTDRNISVEDLLQHLGAGDQSFRRRNSGLDKVLSIRLVGMSRAHEIHRNVRVDENQRDELPR